MLSDLTIVVKQECAEKVRKALIRLNLLDMERKPISQQKFVYFPLIKEPSKDVLDILKQICIDFKILSYELPQRKKRFKGLVEEFRGRMPEDLLRFLPRSFESVGDILIIEIPNEILSYKYEIGKVLVRSLPNINVVLMKLGSVSGTFRIRNYEVIAGEQRTHTIHREHGCVFYVDLSKAYFSPRLSEEHKRIMRQVKDNEVVVDLFTGIGPFAILIAKNHKAKVYAIDLNPSAIALLKRSIELNKLVGEIIPIVGDAREVVNQKLANIADHVIMNLPGHALEFIDVACRCLKHGGIMHLYAFMPEPDPEEKLIRHVSLLVNNFGRHVSKVINVRRVRESAPHEYHMAIDVMLD